jgi:hypothetical protein
MNVCVDAHRVETNICGGFPNRAVGSMTDRDAHDKGSGEMEDAKNFECRQRFTAFAYISSALTSDQPLGTVPSP